MRSDVKRMKKAYAQALLQLCEMKPLNKITVCDVIEATQTARQTFYNHFKDIKDLINYVPTLFYEEYGHSPYSRDGVEAADQYVLEHKAYFSQLAKDQGQNNFRETYTQWLREGMYDLLFTEEDYEAPDFLSKRLIVDVYIHGLVGIFLEWCASDMSWPLPVLLDVYEAAMPNFIRESHKILPSENL